MPRESMDEAIRKALDRAFEERDQKVKEEKDPKAWLEGTMRRVFNEEFDKRLSEGRKKGAPAGSGDDDDDEAGFFAKLVGG